MKVYTKTGDDGTTGLIGGTRVKKYHDRLEAYGTVDELNSWIGLIRSQEIGNDHIDTLIKIQELLFVIGGNLATDYEKSNMKEYLPCTNEDIQYLEKEMDRMNESLPEMRAFVLPGGNNVVSFCHIARTICRRTERLTIKLSEELLVDLNVIKYLNRLSDYLFVLSRRLTHDQNVKEIPWILKK
ncbi:cob(I)yrinic acid a,c-diamide adenosyltransferase [Puteibacter caeruleilacunae]|nr:cob(I)yrinic acid a,c-diamide adenosyltransferase [Puteibacter caeruleilacunae]